MSAQSAYRFGGHHSISIRVGCVEGCGLTVQEAAAWLRVEVRTIYRMINDGRLRPAVNVPTDAGGLDRHLFTFNEILRAESNFVRHKRRAAA